MPILFANAGTPLLWAGAAHLLVGNVFVGLLEGWLLSWLFRVPPSRTCPWMVAANYFSMIVGKMSVDWVTQRMYQATIGNLGWYLALTALGFFAATVLLEWPFVFCSLSKRKRRVSSSLLGSLAAQTVSYALLGAIYWQVSSIT